MLKLRRGRLALVSAVAALSVLGATTGALANGNHHSPLPNPAHVVYNLGELICDNNDLSGEVCDSLIDVGEGVFILGGILVPAVFFALANVYETVVDVVGFGPFGVLDALDVL